MQHFRPDDIVGLSPGTTARHWRAWLRGRLAPFGLNEAMWMILCHLSDAGGSLTQHELSEQTGLEGSMLAHPLAEMEGMGLIERSDGGADRRSRTIRLTAEAEPIHAEINGWIDHLREQMVDGLSESEIADFRNILAKLSHNVGKFKTGRFLVPSVTASRRVDTAADSLDFRRSFDGILLSVMLL
jgi:MarR family transcriptional regulator for hemolysin